MTDSVQPSDFRVWRATLVSAAVAGVILLTTVLPAEFGIDPLGTGKALGLLGLSREPQGAVTEQPSAFSLDQIYFELAPFESVEYKFRLEAGASLIYSWSATGEVVYDLHAEPDGAEEGFAESFAAGRGERSHGTYTAPFPGIHGWFWENRGTVPVTVELSAAGFADKATEFRGGWETQRPLQDVRAYLGR